MSAEAALGRALLACRIGCGKPRIGAGLRTFALAVAALLAPIAAGATEVYTADESPELPRYRSLAADRVNMRTGPGRDYPIAWQYRLQGLPVVVTAVFDNWRRVRDLAGTEGWVHRSLLSGQRTALVTAAHVNLYARRDPASTLEAQLTRRVVARLETCREGWCRLAVEGHTGWARKKGLWGVAPPQAD